MRVNSWSGSVQQDTLARQSLSVLPDVTSLPHRFWRDPDQELDLAWRSTVGTCFWSDATPSQFLIVFPSRREQFLELARQWEEETRLYSADWQIFGRPVYSEIVDMGESVVTFILEILQQRPDYGWCVALSEITGENPAVSPEEAGQVRKLSTAWVRWGERNGYL